MGHNFFFTYVVVLAMGYSCNRHWAPFFYRVLLSFFSPLSD